MNEHKQDFTINIYQKYPKIRTTYDCIVLNRTNSFCILPSSYWIAVYRVESCLFVSHMCVFLTVRCDSYWVVLDRYTPSYCIVVHHVYILLILVGLYVTVAHLIASYWFAPPKQHKPVRIRKELIGMLTRWDTNQQELTQIDTMLGDPVRIDFNSQDQYDCFEHFKTIVLACGCGRSNTEVTAN